jgi:NADH-quinone oxidoreductase subunit N
MEIITSMRHEMLLILILIVLLILKVSGKAEDNRFITQFFNFALVINFIVGWFPVNHVSLFGNMFNSNGLLQLEKNILNAATLLISLFSVSWFHKLRHLPEFLMLMVTALLGMFLMLSTKNLLMFYLAIEISAIPVAALCNFSHEERRSSEAAMKMIFSSAFSSCLMLLGISFLYGATGSIDFSFVSMGDSPLLTTGFVLFFSGIVFKLSVVPFHFWTADVYEGSPVAVTSFLSVVSKGSMVFVFSSILYNMFDSLRAEWYLMLCLLSVATMITGNLFAIRQQNLKRFLAFSSITQIGFILIGISGRPDLGMATSIYFIVVYMFSNLAAFAVISRISDTTGKETIDDYRGLVRTNPVLAWSMAIALFSLAGIPPTAGFFGKIFLLTSGASQENYILITIAALNMIVSLYYYLRVIRAMFMENTTEHIPKVTQGSSFNFAIYICLAGIIVTGFFGTVYEYIHTLSISH